MTDIPTRSIAISPKRQEIVDFVVAKWMAKMVFDRDLHVRQLSERIEADPGRRKQIEDQLRKKGNARKILRAFEKGSCFFFAGL